MTTFNASLTNLTALLPQSHNYSSYLSRPILAPPPLWLHKHTDLRVQVSQTHWSTHTRLCVLFTCDISLGSRTLLTPDARAFVELILLYIIVSLVLLQCHTIIMHTKQGSLFRVRSVLNEPHFLITFNTEALHCWCTWGHDAADERSKWALPTERSFVCRRGGGGALSLPGQVIVVRRVNPSRLLFHQRL
jgi:hypothetical protein